MSIGQVIVTIVLLAQVYGVDPGLLDCMAHRESEYSTTAVNGVHTGVMQWNPETLRWLGEKAQGDPLWLHGHMDPGETVYQIALAAWAIKNGYGEHWATWEVCQ